MTSLQDKITTMADAELRQIMPLGSDVSNQLDNADVLLLGPLTVDPLKQVQRAHQQNKVISIVVLIFPAQYQKTRQQIQLGFNVGKNLTLLPYEFGKDISMVVDGAARRSQQRKSFLKISARFTPPPPPVGPPITVENLALVLEHAPIGAMIVDAEKRVLSVNRVAKLYFPSVDFGARVEWSDLFPDEVLPSGKKWDQPFQDVLKVEGRYLEVNISSLGIGEHSAHQLLLLNDVTRAISIENQLRSKIEELEFLNKELDEFANVVSHDFKTPLTSISLLAQLALREKSQDKQLDFLKQILSSSRKLKEQLNGLNKLVSLKKNRAEKIEQVNFQERLNIILSEYGDLAEMEAEVVSNFSKAPGISYFTAHIDSLFNNLITNAIKYRKKDQPLKVELESRQEQEFVVITIKDNGIGIDLTKNMNKLFQPFKRLSDQGTGTGLGLSLVKRMIEQANGYIEVFSELGLGTQFKVHLKKQV